MNEIVLFNTNDIFTDAIGNLAPGHGTIAAFTRVGQMGHAIVLYRDIQGNLVILDTQSQQYYNGIESINNFIKEKNFFSILLPYKNSGDRWLGKRKYSEYNMFTNAISNLKIQEEPSMKRPRTSGGKKNQSKKNKKRRTKKNNKRKSKRAP